MSIKRQIEVRDRLVGLAAAGSQVILATHSPVFAGIPDAQVFEATATGIAVKEWRSTDLYNCWRELAA